jgi:hypothetical protein
VVGRLMEAFAPRFGVIRSDVDLRAGNILHAIHAYR